MLQIVDIALKAISPAVNDPTTAISCVDQLSRILIRFVSREPPEELLYDPPGIVRASIGWIHFERLLEAAFEQIRMYSKTDVAVSLRLLRALGDMPPRRPIRSSAGYSFEQRQSWDSGRLRRKAWRRGAESVARSPGRRELHRDLAAVD